MLAATAAAAPTTAVAILASPATAVLAPQPQPSWCHCGRRPDTQRGLGMIPATAIASTTSTAT
eukprot:221675-Chlamydomonas_euryale.AAC.2